MRESFNCLEETLTTTYATPRDTYKLRVALFSRPAAREYAYCTNTAKKKRTVHLRVRSARTLYSTRYGITTHHQHRSNYTIIVCLLILLIL